MFVLVNNNTKEISELGKSFMIINLEEVSPYAELPRKLSNYKGSNLFIKNDVGIYKQLDYNCTYSIYDQEQRLINHLKPKLIDYESN